MHSRAIFFLTSFLCTSLGAIDFYGLQLTLSTNNIEASGGLRDALNQINNAPGLSNVITIPFAALTDQQFQLPPIEIFPGNTLFLKGDAGGTTFDGLQNFPAFGPFRGFFVSSGIVSFENLTIQNTLAKGGDGGTGRAGGGGGMGAGGALFINGGATARLRSVTIDSSKAQGGNGGNFVSVNAVGGGGGGMGGNGGDAGNSSVNTLRTGGGGGGLFGAGGIGGTKRGGSGGGGLFGTGATGGGTGAAIGAGGGGGGALNALPPDGDGNRGNATINTIGGNGGGQTSGVNGRGGLNSGNTSVDGEAGGWNTGGGGGGGGTSGVLTLPPGVGGNGGHGGGGGGGAAGNSASAVPAVAGDGGTYGGGGSAGIGLAPPFLIVVAGTGGFGGGGGGGSFITSPSRVPGGPGGFGGGAGASISTVNTLATNGVQGGFGGGGSGGYFLTAVGGAGGFMAGAGGNANGTTGVGGAGGGAALGGAIFIYSDMTQTGTLVIEDGVTFNNSQLVASTGGLSGSPGLPGNGGGTLGTDIFMMSGSTIIFDIQTTFTMSSDIVSDNGAGTGDILINGLIKQGLGTVTLSGNNTYTGNTTITNGMLVVNGSIGPTQQTTVESLGTLGGIGTINSPVTVDGTFSPGDLLNFLSVVGDLQLNAGSQTRIVADQSGASGRADVTGNVLLNGTLFMNFSPGSYTAGQQFTVITTTGAISGTFSAVQSNVSLTFHPIYNANSVQVVIE